MRLISVFGALLIIGCSAPAPAAQPVATTAAKPQATTVTLSGRGNMQTAPVALSGGNYRIAWQIKSPADSLCIVAAWLKSADDATVIESLMGMLNVPAGQTATGETYSYRRAAGRYYVQMSTTSCEWTVTIDPSP